MAVFCTGFKEMTTLSLIKQWVKHNHLAANKKTFKISRAVD